MDTQFIILFVILLLALILCTYLGGSNCVEGFAQPIGYTAPNGSIASVTTYTDQTKAITVTKLNGTVTTYNTSRGDTSGRFYNPNGETATLTTDLSTITVTTPASSASTMQTTTIFTGSPIVYTAANDSTATIATNTDGTKTITVTKPDKTETKYSNTTSAPNAYKDTPTKGSATINSDFTTITVTINAVAGVDAVPATATVPAIPAVAAVPAVTTIFNAPVITAVARPVSPSATPSPVVPPHSHDDNDKDKRHSQSYDNYNHYNGSSYASIYYGPNGSTARVVDTGNNNTLVITSKNGTTDIYYIDNNTNKKAYFGPDGSSAKLVSDSMGKTAVEVTSPNGNKINYTEENSHTYSSNIVDNFMGTMTRDSSRSAPGTSYSDMYNPVKPGIGTNASSSTNASNPKYDANTYLASLPNGIPKSDIPFGQEDLYILKSQVVPPVCPACPPPIVKNESTSTTSGNAAFDVSKCPPCAPCARCPEPNFDCKKVPNYSVFNPSTMPVPVLNSFSTFGM